MLSRIVNQATQAVKQEQNTQDRQKITKQEVETAWKVMCPIGDSMSRSESEQWLKVFYPDCPARHLRELVKDGVSLYMLLQLLVEQMPQVVDPNVQALKVLDPEHSGVVNMSTLQRIMGELHKIGPLSERDMQTLMQVADIDMDGKIGLQDLTQFRERHQIVSTSFASAVAAGDQASAGGRKSPPPPPTKQSV